MSNNPEIRVFSTAGTEAGNDKLWKKTVDDTLLTKANVDLTNLSTIGQAKFNSKASVSLDNLNTAGEARFTGKASIDLDNLSPAGEARIASATGGANVSLSNLDATGEARFAGKSNVDLDNISSAGVAVIQSYATGGANVDLSNLSSTGNAKFTAKANISLDNIDSAGIAVIQSYATGGANTDLSNLSATGEARFTEKVNISSIPNFIQGFSSRYASSTTYVVTSGICVSASNDTVISLGSNIIKSMSAFAIGDNNGGLLGTLSQNSWYYQFVIYNPTTNTTDVCHSTSLTPTLPTGFTKYRLVSCFYYTNAITGFSTIANGDTIEYIYNQIITGINTVASVPQNVAIKFPPPSASVPIYLNMFYGHNTTPAIVQVGVDSGAGSPSVINALNIGAYIYFPFVDKLSVYNGATSIRVTTGNNFTGLRIGCSSIIWRR